MAWTFNIGYHLVRGTQQPTPTVVSKYFYIGQHLGLTVSERDQRPVDTGTEDIVKSGEIYYTRFARFIFVPVYGFIAFIDKNFT